MRGAAAFPGHVAAGGAHADASGCGCRRGAAHLHRTHPRASANGSPVGVGIGSDLRGLLRTMRQSADKVLPTLAITRLWAGKAVALEFDRSRADILSLVLTGKEEIRW